MLSASLTGFEISAFEAGLDAIEAAARDVDESSVFAAELPFSAQTLSDLVGLSAGIGEKIDRARTYLDGGSGLTLEGLQDSLYSSDEVASLVGLGLDVASLNGDGLSNRFTFAFSNSLAGQELAFDLATATADVAGDDGSLVSGVSLGDYVAFDADLSVTLDEDSHFSFAVTVGVDGAAEDLSSAVNFEFSEAGNSFRVASGAEGAETTLAARVGLVGAEVTTITTDDGSDDDSFSFVLAGDRMAPGDESFTLAELPALARTGFYTARGSDADGSVFRFHGDVNGSFDGDELFSSRLEIVAAFDATTSALTSSVDLSSFGADADGLRMLSSTALYSAFEQVRSVFDDITLGDAYGVEIPFTDGKSLGDVLDLGEAFSQRVIGALSSPPEDDSPGFERLDELLTIFGGPTDVGGGIEFRSAADGRPAELLFDVSFLYPFLTQEFDLSLGGFADLGSFDLDAATTLLVDGIVEADFTVGILLETPGSRIQYGLDTPLQELNGGNGLDFGTVVAPDNSGLTNGQEVFDLTFELSSGDSFIVDLDAAFGEPARTLSNDSTIGDLIDAIHAARDDHGLTDIFEVTLNQSLNGLVARDLSSPGNAAPEAVFRVTRPTYEQDGVTLDAPSLIGVQLGLFAAGLGETEASDGSRVFELDGGALHGKTLIDNVFLRTDESAPLVSGTVTLTAADIDAAAALGSLELSVADGQATASLTAEFTPTDPGTGEKDNDISLAELRDVLPEFATSVRGVADVASVGKDEAPYGGVLTVEIDPLVAFDESGVANEKSTVYVPFFMIENTTSVSDASLLAGQLNLMLEFMSQGNSPLQEGSDLIKFSADEGRLAVTLTDGVARPLTVKASTDAADILRAGGFASAFSEVLQQVSQSALSLAVPDELEDLAGAVSSARASLDDFLSADESRDIDSAIDEIKAFIDGSVSDIDDTLREAADALVNAVGGGVTPFLNSGLEKIGIRVETGDGDTPIAADLSAYVGRPGVSGGGTLTLPVDFDFTAPGGFNIAGIELPSLGDVLPEISISLPDIDLDSFSLPGAVDLSFVGFEDFETLLNFKDLPITAVVRAFQAGLGYLQGLEGFADLPFLNANIPLLDINLGGLLNVADVFGDLVAELEASPIAGIGLFDEVFEDILGLPENVFLNEDGSVSIDAFLPSFAVSLFPEFNTGLEFLGVKLDRPEEFDTSMDFNGRRFEDLESFLRSDVVQGDQSTVDLSLDLSIVDRPALRIDTTLFVGNDGGVPGVAFASDIQPLNVSGNVLADLSDIAGDDFAIADPTLVDASVGGAVDVGIAARIDLAVGVDLSSLFTSSNTEAAEFDAFLYEFDPGDGSGLDGTSLSLLVATADDSGGNMLSASAALGPFSVDANGLVQVSQGGAAGDAFLERASRFTIGLADGLDDDADDGRIALADIVDEASGDASDLELRDLRFSASGDAMLSLALSFPDLVAVLGTGTEINAGATLSLSTAANTLNDLIAGSLPSSPLNGLDLTAALNDAVVLTALDGDGDSITLQAALVELFEEGISLDGVSSAWSTVFGGLGEVFESTLFAVDLPFIGDRLRNDGSSSFFDVIANVFPPGQTFGSAESQVFDFQLQLSDALDDLGWLQDIGGAGDFLDMPDGRVNLRDVVIKPSFGTNDDGGPSLLPTGYEIDFVLANRFERTFEGMLDLGFDGLGFELDAGGTFGLEFLLQFSAGIDFENGFYIDTDSADTFAEVIVDVAPTLQAGGSLGLLAFDATPRSPAALVLSSGAAGASSEIRFARADDGEDTTNEEAKFFRLRTRATSDPDGFKVSYDAVSRAIEIEVPEGMTSSQLVDALLGPDGEGLFSGANAAFTVELVDGAVGGVAVARDANLAANGLSAVFNATFTEPGTTGNGKLSFSEIVSASSPSDLVAFDSDLNASVYLALDAKQQMFDPSIDIPDVIPPISADLGIDWSYDPILSDTPAAPTVTLDNVSLDAGRLFNGFVAETLGQVSDVLDPIRSVTDIFGTRIPVISDLSGTNVTFLDLARLSGGKFESAAAFIDATRTISEFVDAADRAATFFGAQADSKINLGGARYDVNTDEFVFLGDLAGVAALLETELSAGLADASGNGADEETRNAFSAAGTRTGDFEFALPVLSPTNLMAFLSGKDTTLFTLDLPKFEYELAVSYFYPLPPVPIVGVEIGGSVGAEIDLGFGYDTVGLREFQQTERPLDLLNGFFLSDRENADGTGADIPELVLKGSLTAAAALNAGFVSASVGGGLFATIDFNLNDPNGDGRVRGVELKENAELEFGTFGPIHIFDVSGKLDAGLFAEVEVDLGLFSIEETFDIATIELLNFTFPRPQPEVPTLAVLNAGTLTLNAGDRASFRAADGSSLDRTDGDESFRLVGIADDDGDDGTQTVIVEAFGYAQRFDGVSLVVANMGVGNDRLEVNDGFAVRIDADGGVGDDILMGGRADDVLSGGDGDDTIVAGHGANIVYGDARVVGGLATGDDIIETGVGDDRIEGGGGDDSIRSGDGDDTVSGGDGDDSIDSGPGMDTVRGGGGRDSLVTGSGNDTVYGGDGDDYIESGGGADTVDAGSGDDVVLAGTGDDTVYGGDGRDVIRGDFGSDTLHGDDGEDLIEGGLGGDTRLDGGAGNDRIFANTEDEEDVTVDGTTFVGGTGDDVIRGSSGNDEIWGDLDVGESSEDGADDIAAFGGNDTIRSGGGADLVLGGDGDDTIDAGSGDDVVDGAEGSDFIELGAGSDRATLGTGSDIAFGFTSGGLTRDDFVDVGSLGTFDFTWADLTTDAGLGLGNVVTYSSAVIRPLAQEVGGVRASLAADGADQISGGEGTDWIFGGSGSDQLLGDDGDDFISGGAGDDLVIEGGAGRDVLLGDAGNDVLRGGSGLDYLSGDDGADVLYGDSTDGPAGSREGTQWQALFGGAGNDVLHAYSDVSDMDVIGDFLDGGDGLDDLLGNARNEVLLGGAGNDFIHGDYLHGAGYEVNANAYGTGGDDVVFGDTGDDTLFGGGGNDIVAGGSGFDTIDGQGGADILRGGSDVDLFNVISDRSIATEMDDIDGDGFDDIQRPLDLITDTGLATDILGIVGTNSDDTIVVSGSTDDAIDLRVRYSVGATTELINLALTGVEQIQIVGLGGNDVLGFVSELLHATDAALFEAFNPHGLNEVDFSETGLNTNATDFSAVIDGNGGDDLIVGSNAQDRLDGGAGSDRIWGLSGNDRLWGDSGDGSANDTDVLFAGGGNDDLIGGVGRNLLAAWSYAPATGSQLAGNGYPQWTEDSLAGMPADGFGVIDQATGALEDTGINRMLGSGNADLLFGGTGLDFLYGNGGDDVLFQTSGERFDSADGGLGGDEWKRFARENSQVWYYAGTSLDDDIEVSLATEDGPLQGRHLITRSTDAGGGLFTTDVDLNLSFSNEAFNDRGRFDDVTGRLAQIAALEALEPGGLTDRELADLPGQIESVQADLISSLLPPEGDFVAIVIDGLAGDDRITIDPTVQKTVWIDAGDGNDFVEIKSGGGVLRDAAESATANNPQGRNDTLAQAWDLGTIDNAGTLLTGLTLHDPLDVDYFSFHLETDALLQIASSIDSTNLDVSLIDPTTGETVRANPTILEAGHHVLRITSTDRRVGLYDLRFKAENNYQFFSGQQSWQEAAVAATGMGGHLLTVQSQAEQQFVYDQLLSNVDGGSGTIWLGATDLDVEGEWAWVTNEPFDNDTSRVDDNNDADGFTAWREREPNNSSGNEDYASLVFGANGVDGWNDLSVTNASVVGFVIEYDTERVIELGPAETAERRDVIIGGAGNDRLAGGGGAEWIFGGAGNDVLIGGRDGQLSDLVFGGEGDDIFQLTPDALPRQNIGTNTLFDAPAPFEQVTLSDVFIGGAGVDTVLLQGQTLFDPFGRVVGANDYVAVRFQAGLNRYQVGALVPVVDTDDQNNTTFSYVADDSTAAPDDLLVHFQSFQVRDVERMEARLGDGDDVFRADRGYQFNPGTSEWGFGQGDREAGASLIDLVIAGQGGADAIFGGFGNDLIVGDQASADGGQREDLLVGGVGNDRIFGNGGDDLIYGGRAPGDLADGSFPSVAFDPTNLPAVTGTASTPLLVFANPFSPAPESDRPGLDIGFDESIGLLSFEDAFFLSGDDASSGKSDSIQRVIGLGDFSGDGLNDFLVVGESRSFLFLRPADVNESGEFDAFLGTFNDLTSGADRGLADRADIIFEHAVLGTPGASFGDHNGDGLTDVTFARINEDAEVGVTVVFGGPVEGLPNTVVDRDDLAGRTRVIRLNEHDLSTDGEITVQAIAFNGSTDDGAPVDQLVVTSSSNRGTLDFVVPDVALTATFVNGNPQPFLAGNANQFGLSAQELAGLETVTLDGDQYFIVGGRIWRFDGVDFEQLTDVGITSNTQGNEPLWFRGYDFRDLTVADGKLWYTVQIGDTGVNRSNPVQLTFNQSPAADEWSVGYLNRDAEGDELLVALTLDKPDDQELAASVREYFQADFSVDRVFVRMADAPQFFTGGTPRPGGLVGTDDTLYFGIGISFDDQDDGAPRVQREALLGTRADFTAFDVPSVLPENSLSGFDFAERQEILDRSFGDLGLSMHAWLESGAIASIRDNANVGIGSEEAGAAFYVLNAYETSGLADQGYEIFRNDAATDRASILNRTLREDNLFRFGDLGDLGASFNPQQRIRQDLGSVLRDVVDPDRTDAFRVTGVYLDYQNNPVVTLSTGADGRSLWTYKPGVGATEPGYIAPATDRWVQYTVDFEGQTRDDFARGQVTVSGPNIFVTTSDEFNTISGLGDAKLARITAADNTRADFRTNWTSTPIFDAPGSVDDLTSFMPYEDGVFFTPSVGSQLAQFASGTSTRVWEAGRNAGHFSFAIDDTLFAFRDFSDGTQRVLRTVQNPTFGLIFTPTIPDSLDPGTSITTSLQARYVLQISTQQADAGYLSNGFVAANAGDVIVGSDGAFREELAISNSIASDDAGAIGSGFLVAEPISGSSRKVRQSVTTPAAAFGWGSYDRFYAVGDVNGDGRDDVAAYVDNLEVTGLDAFVGRRIDLISAGQAINQTSTLGRWISLPELSSFGLSDLVQRRLTGNYYRIDDTARSWLDAEAIALAAGGHLVTFESRDEENFVRSSLAIGSQTFSIGATDRDQEGVFEWVTGEVFDNDSRVDDGDDSDGYVNWADSEPNNSGGGQDFVRIDARMAWDDIGNAELSRSLVEFEFGSSVFADLTPDLMSGDFNGDGLMDIALSSRRFDGDSVFVYYDIASDRNSDGRIAGEGIGRSFTLLDGDTRDFNNDGVDDILTVAVGEPGAASGIYVVYGEVPRIQIENVLANETVVELANASTRGAGAFLADDGSNNFALFNNNGTPYSIGGQASRWFTFRTAGDAEAGDAILMNNIFFGLEMTLFDEDGRDLGTVSKTASNGFSNTINRSLPAGRYYIRVFSTSPSAPASFNLLINAPMAGNDSEGDAPSDRNIIYGGDGNDAIFAGTGLDEIYGNDGDDTFTGELFQFRDLGADSGDTGVADPANYPNTVPARDASIVRLNTFGPSSFGGDPLISANVGDVTDFAEGDTVSLEALATAAGLAGDNGELVRRIEITDSDGITVVLDDDNPVTVLAFDGIFTARYFGDFIPVEGDNLVGVVEGRIIVGDRMPVVSVRIDGEDAVSNELQRTTADRVVLDASATLPGGLESVDYRWTFVSASGRAIQSQTTPVVELTSETPDVVTVTLTVSDGDVNDMGDLVEQVFTYEVRFATAAEVVRTDDVVDPLEGDVLTFAAVNPDGSVFTALPGIDRAYRWFVELDGVALVENVVTETAAFRLRAPDQGTYRVTVQVEDTVGLVELTGPPAESSDVVVGDAVPVITVPTGPVSFSQADFSTGGDVPSIAVPVFDPGNDQVSVSITVTPPDGSAISPTGLWTNGVVTLTDLSAAGNYTVIVTATDGDSNESVTAEFVVRVTNTPPTVSELIVSQSGTDADVDLNNVSQGVELIFTALANDPGNNALAYRWVITNQSGQVVFTSDRIVGEDTLIYTPETPGVLKVSVVVDDLESVPFEAGGFETRFSQTIRVLNQAPRIVLDSVPSVTNAGQRVEFTGVVTDLFGDSIRVDLELDNGVRLPAFVTAATDGNGEVIPGQWDYRVSYIYNGGPPPLARLVATDAFGGTATILAKRRVFFYENSAFDNPSGTAAAAAADKTVLVAGQRATFDNYISSPDGITGIMWDLTPAQSGATITASDFSFRVGNTDNTSTWATLSATPTVVYAAGKGITGGDRVTLTFAPGEVINTWLEVSLVSIGGVPLQQRDTFYVGSAVGEVGDNPHNAVVNATDAIRIRANSDPTKPVDATSRYDINRDGFVNVLDEQIAFANINFLDPLRLITPTGTTNGTSGIPPRNADRLALIQSSPIGGVDIGLGGVASPSLFDSSLRESTSNKGGGRGATLGAEPTRVDLPTLVTHDVASRSQPSSRPDTRPPVRSDTSIGTYSDWIRQRGEHGQAASKWAESLWGALDKTALLEWRDR